MPRRNFKDSNLFKMDKADQTMPSYMKKNLINMPNNKGYIYKDVWFFGHKERESKTQIMFEKIDKDILHVYKITDKYIIKTEKNQTTNKTKLISKEKRVKLFNNINI